MHDHGGESRLIPRERRRRRPRAVAQGLSLLAALLLAGCATRQPQLPPFPESLLLTDYSTWFAADVEGNRELLRFVLDELDSGLLGVVDRTDRIVGGARLIPGQPADVSAVASGSFPKGGVELVLGTDRDFERRSAQVDQRNRVYFRRREGTLQLALPANDYLYASTGRVLAMLRDRPPAELELEPELYRSLRRVGRPGQPDALLVFDEPGVGFLRSLGVDARGLPIARIELSMTVRRDGGPAAGEAPALELGGAIVLRSEQNAGLFGRLSRLFVLVFVRALGLESANVRQEASIAVEGQRVLFSGIPMRPGELVAVVHRLSGSEQTVEDR
jgi:hypothetical protein